jgi:hypothetical protein
MSLQLGKGGTLARLRGQMLCTSEMGQVNQAGMGKYAVHSKITLYFSH